MIIFLIFCLLFFFVFSCCCVLYIFSIATKNSKTLYFVLQRFTFFHMFHQSRDRYRYTCIYRHIYIYIYITETREQKVKHIGNCLPFSSFPWKKNSSSPKFSTLFCFFCVCVCVHFVFRLFSPLVFFPPRFYYYFVFTQIRNCASDCNTQSRAYVKQNTAWRKSSIHHDFRSPNRSAANPQATLPRIYT